MVSLFGFTEPDRYRVYTFLSGGGGGGGGGGSILFERRISRVFTEFRDCKTDSKYFWDYSPEKKLIHGLLEVDRFDKK